MPGTADNIIQPNKTGWVRLYYIKFSSWNAHILLFLAFLEENMGHFLRLILTTKTKLIHLPLSGHASLRSKSKTVHIQDELIHSDASWEYSLHNETRLQDETVI